MGSRRERNGNEMAKSSVLGYITVYKYGKMYSPSAYRTGKCKQRGDPRSNFDRPGLISKIHRLLAIHRALRREDCSKVHCNGNGIHKALLRMIRLCFEQRICQSKLYPVGDLFLELFLCTGNTCTIFSVLDSHMTMTSRLMNTDVNILYSNHVPNENNEALEYYLQHISSVSGTNRMDFINNEIDPHSGTTPLIAGVQKRDPALVLILLRYGADPFLSPEYSSVEDRIQNPTEQLIDDLNGLFLFQNTGFSDETRAKLAAEESKVWEILSYFRRAVPDIPLTSTNHIVTTLAEEDADCVEYIDDRFLAKQMYGIHPRITETINLDFFKPTVSLKHLCRCAVRNHLKGNQSKGGSIPKAISLLPLPTKLQNYIDLLVD